MSEQIGDEADDRLGAPGQRPSFGMALGLCKVYAEVRRCLSWRGAPADFCL